MQALVLLVLVVNVVVNVMLHLVAQHARELVLICRELHHRRRDVHVSSGNRKRIGRSLANENEMKRDEVLRIRDGSDFIGDRLQHGVVRRRLNDLAFLHELLVFLLPDLHLPLRLRLRNRIGVRRGGWNGKRNRRDDGNKTRERAGFHAFDCPSLAAGCD